MTVVTGEIQMLTFNGLHHPVGAQVHALQGGQVLGQGTVDEDYRFEMEIPADTRGELELRLILVDAAPSTVEADGNDLDVVILYNPINNAFA